MGATITSHPVLLYDGLCGFCDRSVQLILRNDSRMTLLFAPLQGDYAKEIVARHPELRGIDSLVFVEPSGGAKGEKAYVRSDAALRVANYLGGAWKLALVAYAVPRFIRDYLYDQFAKRRYRWFGKYESCKLPSPEVR
ncbi:MAG TPA: DCC1-like thiol-disulfide oxidoreductase family protein, partial [Blastocatellia bacterium]|nr:DCC1-like thiol-disulfide oxidoreductase family protein [Blastocatellia bacterium]